MKYALLGLKGLLTLAFLGAGGMKLSGAEELAAQFAEFGLPAFSMYVVGALEVLGAIGLWLKKTTLWAAAGLAAVMVGAVGSHVLAGHGAGQTLPSAVLGVLAIGVIVLTRKTESPEA